ncbi:phosphatase PAP2 family protein [Vibrio gangliei]|uniref:phosphatase PAP2 family protein n=1 Tax=Vibrio gangliei TaxID=2077090 RepID=UPI001473FF64|nr:phosphatase PAP2 family protein [Vibrio gangliei]
MAKKNVYLWLAFIWLGLAITPATLLVTHQQLFPRFDLTHWVADSLFALTSTGTAPYAVISVLVFYAISYWFMPKIQWQRMLLAVTLSLTISFTLNHALKSYFEEPRPNATWLSQQTNSPLDLETFYQQNTEQRRDIIQSALEQYRDAQDPTQLHTKPGLVVSIPLQKHWIHEVGYAFPSGHTIFAITLVLTASYYLLLSGATGLNIVVFLWGLSMGISRMILGMHWPQDVLASTCIAVLISSLSVVVVNRVVKGKE